MPCWELSLRALWNSDRVHADWEQKRHRHYRLTHISRLQDVEQKDSPSKGVVGSVFLGFFPNQEHFADPWKEKEKERIQKANLQIAEIYR